MAAERTSPGSRAPCQRLALHATRLVLPAPHGAQAVYEAPLSPDLTALLHWLDGEWTPEAHEGDRRV